MSSMKHLMDTIYDLFLGGYGVTEIATKLNVDVFMVFDALWTMLQKESK